VRSRKRFLRDFEAGRSFDLFLLAAVTTILVTRFTLRLAGYPELGRAGLHVAHVLWGGLLMAAAVVLLVSFLDRATRRLATLLAGVGFGLFIDEVGKFVTHDSDYFFRPAVSLIYISFILLYLGARSLRDRGALQQEYLLNALQEVHEAAVDDLDSDERDRALAYLAHGDARNPMVSTLRSLLLRSEVIPRGRPGPLAYLRGALIGLYRKLAALPAFVTGVTAFFVAQLCVRLAHVVLLVLLAHRGAQDRTRVLGFGPAVRPLADFTLVDWAQLVSSLLSAVFVLLGVAVIRGSRLQAFRMFQRSVLVTIFLTQVFMFYAQQFWALLGLLGNLLLYLALRFVIQRERIAQAQHG
jgi:hypothetical protein